MDDKKRPEILSGILRILLQIGNTKEAAKLCQQVVDIVGPDDNQALRNKALLLIADNSYREAHEVLLSLVQQYPEDYVAVNNIAVCLLYMGQMKEALKVLENAVAVNPSVFLQEGTLFNLCTIYELESCKGLEKKLRILDAVASLKGDGFNTGCLKIEPESVRSYVQLRRA